MQRTVLAALLTVLGTGSTPARAGTNVWTSIGPDLGTIRTLAVDPQNPGTVYAVAGSGTLFNLYGVTGSAMMFKTTDGGASWNAMASPGPMAAVLAIDPQNPSTMYVVGDGIFKSRDGGTSWIAANSGLPPPGPCDDYCGTYDNVISLAIDPQNPSTIYAVTSGSGVYKSTNGGATWSAANAGLPGPLTSSAFAIDPKSPGTLYCTAWGGTDVHPNYKSTIYKSTDGGVSWSLANSSLADSLNIFALAVDPQNTATVYAAGQPLAGSQPWLFRSADGGASWTAASSGLPDYPVYGPTFPPLLALDPQHTGTLYVVGPNRGTSSVPPIFKTTDGGETWTAVGSGLVRELIYALVIDPRDPSTLYAGTDKDGVFKSADGGTTWSRSNAGLAAAPVSAIAVDPQHSGTLYAALESGCPLVKTTDGGATWSAANAGLPAFPSFLGGSFSALAIDPQNPSTVYAAGCDGMFKSTDRGASWTVANWIDGVYGLAIDPGNPTTLYWWSWYYKGLYKSRDGAESWTALPVPLTDRIFSLVIDSQEPNTIYASTDSQGVVKSIDGGASWNRVNIGQPPNPGEDYPKIALAIDPTNSGRLYAISYRDGVFKSADGGVSWTAVSSGLPTDRGVHHLFVDPQTPSTIYGVTYGHGIFKTTDGGASWNAVNSGLTTPYVQTLAIDPRNPSAVYAVTDGGVFAITFVP